MNFEFRIVLIHDQHVEDESQLLLAFAKVIGIRAVLKKAEYKLYVENDHCNVYAIYFFCEKVSERRKQQIQESAAKILDVIQSTGYLADCYLEVPAYKVQI